MSSIEIPKACEMINLDLLNVREDNKQRSKLWSELEEAKIYVKDNEHAIHIGVDLHLINKFWLVQLMNKYKLSLVTNRHAKDQHKHGLSQVVH